MSNILFSLFDSTFQTVLFVVCVVFLIILLYILVNKNNRNKSTPDEFEKLYQRIKEEIRFAVTPKFMDVSIRVNELVDLAVEVWRIEQRVAKSASNLPENQLKGLDNSIQKLKRYLEKYDIEIVDYKNAKYNDGLNLDILSVEKDPTLTEPKVKEIIEPTIMYKAEVVRKAKITLLTNI